jgi:flagellar motor switch protein FliG
MEKVFHKIRQMDDIGIQKMLKEMSSTKLASMLTDAPDDVKKKVFENLSAQAAKVIPKQIEDLKAMDPKEIIKLLHRAEFYDILDKLSTQGVVVAAAIETCCDTGLLMR